MGKRALAKIFFLNEGSGDALSNKGMLADRSMILDYPSI
jgi:hypothetical protein